MAKHSEQNEVIDPKKEDICEDIKKLRLEDQTRRLLQRKSSFERFGDDLTESILQYLSLEDKFRLECVSKQWRDLIYNKQFVIDLREMSRRLREGCRPRIIKRLINLFSNNKLKTKEDHRKKMEILFGKCPHVYRITCENEFILETLIEPIGWYCSRLKSIDFNVNNMEEKEILDFARSYGQKLESLRINISVETNSREIIKKFLGYCSKLKTIIDINDIEDRGEWHNLQLEYFLNVTDPTYLPELQHIMPRLFTLPLLGRLPVLHLLADKNGLTMKSIKLDILNPYEFTDMTFKQLIRMKNLQTLSLQFSCCNSTSARKLSELFGHLPKLKRFELIVRKYYSEESLILTDISMLINALINIEKLDLKFMGKMFDIEGEPRDYGLTSLRKLTKLKRLEMAFESNNYRIHMFGHSLFGSNITLKNMPEVKVEILKGIESQGIECQNVIAFGKSLAKVYPKTKFKVTIT